MQSAAAAIHPISGRGRSELQTAGPAWFTSVMGTGILAICVTIAPIPIPFGQPIAATLFIVATTLFLAIGWLWLCDVVRHPRTARATLNDTQKAQVWGAPPMACFTIAVGFLKIGESLFSPAACVLAAQILFVAGVVGSIACAFVVPFLMFTQHELRPENTAGNWLLPVVPPIVASVPAALLSPSWPEAVRGDMLGLAYALLGIGGILAAIIIVLFYSRLVYHKVPGGALVTTTWLVVGPLGQSIAGFIALGTAAKTVWPQFGESLSMAGIGYGVIVWGFAMYWLVMAIALTARGLRRGIPFNLGWWAFTFPVGVLTAGTDALYVLTRAHIFALASLALIALLAAMWSMVAAKTVLLKTGVGLR